MANFLSKNYNLNELNIGYLKLNIYHRSDQATDVVYPKFIESIFNIDKSLTPCLELNLYFQEAIIDKVIKLFDLCSENESIPPEIQPIFDEILFQKLELQKGDLNWVRYYMCGDERFINVTSMNIIYRYVPDENDIFIYLNQFSWAVVFEVIHDLILANLENFLILHASTIKYNNSIMSFAGRSQSGKTSISLLCAENDLHNIISDDITILDRHFRIVPYRRDVKIPISYAQKHPSVLNSCQVPSYISGKNKYMVLLPGSCGQSETIQKLYVLTPERDACKITSLDSEKLQVLLRNKCLFPAFFSHAFWCIPFLGKRSNYIFSYVEGGLELYKKFLAKTDIFWVQWDYSHIKDIKKLLLDI
jgi:hypothetical protein